MRPAHRVRVRLRARQPRRRARFARSGPAGRARRHRLLVTGRAALGAWSGGTLASLAGAIAEPGFAFRDGHLVAEPNGRHVQSFELRGKEVSTISIGASEHFALPRLEPALREVGVHLGSAGRLSRLLQALSIPTDALARAPVAGPALRALTARLPGTSSSGPDAASRARVGSHVVAVARDATGRRLSEVHLDGQNPYAFTAAILAWGAQRAAERGLEGAGALGPVDGFGLDALEQGCREAGLARV